MDSGDDLVGHGTAVASIIAANNDDGFGMAGFGGATRVISFRDDLLSDESIAIATTKLVSLGVRIINISAGGRRVSSPLLQDAVQKAIAAGVLVVGSAGNDGLDVVSYPASNLQPPGGGLSYGLAVGATNFDGTRAAFSNQGTHLSLVAPGNYTGGCYGVLAGALADRARLGRLVLPDVPRRRRRALHVRGGNLVLRAGSLRRGGARLGGRAAAQELRGRGDPQAKRPPSLVRLEPVPRLGLARRRRRARGRDRKVERRRAQHQGLRLRPRRRARNGRVTARGSVAWADAVPPDTPTTVSCAASVNGSPLHVVEQSLVAGALKCAGRRHPASTGRPRPAR